MSEVPDLKLRTFQFGVRCVKFAEALPQPRSGPAIANQLVRSGASVGANCRSPRRGRSRAEFIAKPGLAEEECDGTLNGIEMIDALNLIKSPALNPLRKEADEIFSNIIAASKTAKIHPK